MIQGIFYARFFPRQGTRIVAQSPPGCIVPVPGVDKPCLFDFGVLQEYIIPRQAFRNRYITVNEPSGKYSVLGFPVSINDSKYDRNEFIFNFGLVVEAAAVRDGGTDGHDAGPGGDDNDQVPYERVVRRLAATFAEMEKQTGFLSQDQSARPVDDSDGSGGSDSETQSPSKARAAAAAAVRNDHLHNPVGSYRRRPIESLLEIIKEDLNNYGECMIPVDDANTLNMKLFPHHATPPIVRGWHVPVAKVKFADVVDPTWDLTLQRVVAHVDGVADVRRIAQRADVSLDLAKLALRHLLYYDTVLLLDIFLFGACYAPRPGIHDFVANVGGMVDECANYVCAGGAVAVSAKSTGADDGGGGAEGSSGQGASGNGAGEEVLMTTFCVGKTVAEWLKLHMDAGLDVLRFVDVRRLVQFGVIKGCLYRVHKHVVSKQYLAALATGQARPVAGGDPLQRYTDGCHTFDQIMTEQGLTDAEAMEKLKRLSASAGDLGVIYK
ncbi:nitrogen permease regulator 2 [Schizothecium vesticola]|uniref:Nitrogen permease regulator 2 n=1 Tax=Schizothecium vesticola TaxID=314040 RepID=A0AA40EVP1_9PEZI|nr:nitrogen permease regulator 2 [Schizothecium vesticola]